MIANTSNPVFISVLLFSLCRHTRIRTVRLRFLNRKEFQLGFFLIQLEPRILFVNCGATNSQSDRHCLPLHAAVWGRRLFASRLFAWTVPTYCFRPESAG